MFGSDAINNGHPSIPAAPIVSQSTDSEEDTSSWRLPLELMEKVCSALTDARALGTLASLQSTSMDMYTLATPHLYRHLIFNPRTAVQFLELFNGIDTSSTSNNPTSDTSRFLDFQIVDPTIHLLDQHIADRLRSFMTYTESFSFLLQDNIRLYLEDRERIRGFSDLVDLYGISTDRRRSLWPSVNQVNINLSDWVACTGRPTDPSWNSGHSHVRYKLRPLLNVLFQTMHPANMSIVLPRPPVVDFYRNQYSDGRDWIQVVAPLEADHIELEEFYPTTPTCIPKAKQSLFIHFRMWRYRPITSVETGHNTRNRIQNMANSVTRGKDKLSQIGELRLIGITKRHEDDPGSAYDDLQESEAMFDLRHELNEVMWVRLHNFKNRKDLKMAIMLDSSPESEAEAEWHTFKVPKEDA